MRRLRSAVILACIVAALSGSQSLAAGPEVLAKVGETEVTIEEIRDGIGSLSAAEQAALERDPSLLSQVVRTLLVQRLVLQEATAKQWDKQPAVKVKAERARQTAIAQSYLESVATPPETYPSEAELQAAYDANKAALLVPRQFKLAQIFIALPKEGAEKAAAKLETLKAALKQRNADFASLARDNSDDAGSAEKGGEIGWLAENQIQPEIRARLGGLAKDTVSEPIRLNDGWHFIKVLEVKEAYTPELAEIRNQLASQLRIERAKANSQAYVTRLVQQHPVAINELALGKAFVRPEARAAATPAPTARPSLR
jgi:parvulin-like peptidyl-prolyl isomerase